jgi:hypothetical protein
MTTNRQLLANKENAKKSTGPRTQAVLFDRTARRRDEGAWTIDDIAGWKRAERRVEVIDVWVREFQCDAVHAELIRDNVCGC